MAEPYIVPEAEVRERAKADGITHLSTGIAVTHNGKILVVRRAADDFLGGSYELPGGGVDDETLAESVGRELLEETGLHVVSILGMFPGFDYTTPVKPKVRQFNFLVETSGHDVTLSPEHDAFAWLDETNLHNLAATGPMHDCFQQALYLAQKLA